MNSQAPACCSGVPAVLMYQAPPPICRRPGSSMPGTSAAPMASWVRSTSAGSMSSGAPATSVSPCKKASMVVAAVDVSMVIDALWLAMARYWSICPGRSGTTVSNPAVSISSTQVNRSVVTSVSKAAAVVSPGPRPLSLSTIGWPAPVSHISMSGGPTLRITGRSTTPASLICWAYWRTSSSVSGVSAGSSDAARGSGSRCSRASTRPTG